LGRRWLGEQVLERSIDDAERREAEDHVQRRQPRAESQAERHRQAEPRWRQRREARDPP
jgi:hypothetical protein